MSILMKRVRATRRPTRHGRQADATDLLVWGATAHLAVDWLTQNEWMADHKHRLVHPAGYVHAGAHAAAQALVFPAPYAAALGLAHMVIDTRQPLKLWTKLVSQPDEGPAAVSVTIWRDQAAHMVSIAAAALLSPTVKLTGRR
ncbi:MAG: DUF3307 domain-containing protein [Solirubrobacteraceae bacterium]